MPLSEPEGLWWDNDVRGGDDNHRWYFTYGDHRIAWVLQYPNLGQSALFHACFFEDEIREASFETLAEGMAWCEEVSKAWAARKMLGG
jgi:hypothetical protein